jgi:hypothetical protein
MRREREGNVSVERLMSRKSKCERAGEDESRPKRYED